jgi:hypothetical protein
MIIDLQSILVVGFFLVYLFGDAYVVGPVVFALLITLSIAVFLDFVIGMQAVNSPAGSGWRYAWIAFSEVLSATALIMMGGVFVLRYGLVALPFLITSGFYATIQRPIYSGVFINLNPQPTWFLAVAIGKLLIASLFFLYFFAPLEKYPALNLPPVSSAVQSLLRKRLKRFGYYVGPPLLFLAEELVRHIFSK